MKKSDINKESDRLTAASNKALYEHETLKAKIKEAMTYKETVRLVKEFIFSGDPEAVSPLQHLRD